MRFTVPFLLAIAVYVATVLGANQTSFNPNEDMLFDVVTASDAIAFRLERALGIAEQPALMIGALLLSLPALLTFHLFRVGFGGSISSLVQEERHSRQLAKEREQRAAARYATAGEHVSVSQDGEVLARSRAGDNATPVGSAPGGKDRRSGDDRRNGDDRRRGPGANIAAAIKGGASRKGAPASPDTSSGTTNLSGAAASKSTGVGLGLKDRWSGILENKPDLSRLKSGAQNLRQRMGTRGGSSSTGGSTSGTSSGSTKLSLDDIADD